MCRPQVAGHGTWNVPTTFSSQCHWASAAGLDCEQPDENHVEHDFIVLEIRGKHARWKRTPRFSTDSEDARRSRRDGSAERDQQQQVIEPRQMVVYLRQVVLLKEGFEFAGGLRQDRKSRRSAGAGQPVRQFRQ